MASNITIDRNIHSARRSSSSCSTGVSLSWPISPTDKSLEQRGTLTDGNRDGHILWFEPDRQQRIGPDVRDAMP